mmetsp:Transcript_41961/g.115762  ORF Transcript_41961/g.115762 Transcript_41961/m.115762 type:complete len:309 (-) Transcript_41961:15-941(-)
MRAFPQKRTSAHGPSRTIAVRCGCRGVLCRLRGALWTWRRKCCSCLFSDNSADAQVAQGRRRTRPAPLLHQRMEPWLQRRRNGTSACFCRRGRTTRPGWRQSRSTWDRWISKSAANGQTTCSEGARIPRTRRTSCAWRSGTSQSARADSFSPWLWGCMASSRASSLVGLQLKRLSCWRHCIAWRRLMECRTTLSRRREARSRNTAITSWSHCGGRASGSLPALTRMRKMTMEGSRMPSGQPARAASLPEAAAALFPEAAAALVAWVALEGDARGAARPRGACVGDERARRQVDSVGRTCTSPLALRPS